MIRHGLVRQAAAFHATCRIRLAGVSADDALAAVLPDGDTMFWVVAHLVRIQNQVMALVGEPPAWDHPWLDTVGLAPLDHPTPTDLWEPMVSGLVGSADRCIVALVTLDDVALSEPMVDPLGAASTRAGILALLITRQVHLVSRLGAGLDVNASDDILLHEFLTGG